MGTMRITGIASGLDTDSIISVLVAARRVPVDNLESKVADEQDMLDSYTEMQTLANTLQDASNALTKSSLWTQKVAESSDTSILTATAASGSSGTYKVQISKLASAEIVRGTTQSTSAKYSGSFKINDIDVTVNANSSLSGVATAINNAKAGVKAYVISNKLVIENEETGDTSGADNPNAITFTDGTEGLLSTLGILVGGVVTTDKTDGTNLEGTVNGVAVSNASNTFTPVTGVSITATKKTSGDDYVTVSVANDTDGIKEAVNEFLDAYNALYSYIDDATAVSTNSSGEAISAGALQGQFYATSFETKLFSMMSTMVTSNEVQTYNSLSKIGITRDDDTGAYSISDEDSFFDALDANLEDVQNLFMGGDSRGYYGIAKTMNDYLSDNVLNKLDGSLVSIIDETSALISSNNDKIDDMNTRLLAYETNLYTHFASMENMVQSWNSQLQYLLSNLGLSS